MLDRAGQYATMLVVVLLLANARADEPAGALRLKFVGRASGLSFTPENGTRGRHDLPEIMGGGIALLDADGDGRLDVYVCNGGPIDGPTRGPRDGSPCRLYQNIGKGRFVDQTDRANAPGPSYAMGAAAADYDGDGHVDLFVTGWRDQRLYRNVGGGRFEDATLRAGLTAHHWGTSSAWCDLDADGDLDLFVATYVGYDPTHAPYCAAPDGRRDYCGPEEFPAQPDRLYRNNADGTFTEVGLVSGVGLAEGRGLGVVVADLVGDPRPDVFVANDGTPCHLFENLGGLRFREVAAAVGVAVDGQGEPLAGMGVAVGDIDGDGRADLLVGNLHGRSTVAFLRKGDRSYVDASRPLGLTARTRTVTGFGLTLLDLDGDGRLDLLQANGHVLDRDRLGIPFRMRPTILRNTHEGFVGASHAAPDWTGQATLGRGLAVGDLDGDRRPDFLVASLDASPALLLNRTSEHFVVIEPRGRSTRARTPFGSRLWVELGGRVVAADLSGGGSYLSCSEARIHVARGGAPRVDQLTLTWPSGRTERWLDLPVDSILRPIEGSGESVPVPPASPAKQE